MIIESHLKIEIKIEIFLALIQFLCGFFVSVSAMLPCPLLFIIIPLPPNQNQ